MKSESHDIVAVQVLPAEPGFYVKHDCYDDLDHIVNVCGEPRISVFDRVIAWSVTLYSNGDDGLYSECAPIAASGVNYIGRDYVILRPDGCLEDGEGAYSSISDYFTMKKIRERQEQAA